MDLVISDAAVLIHRVCFSSFEHIGLNVLVLGLK